jgi:CRP/FNR family cyclic AMP-dependent transcriptional regulator
MATLANDGFDPKAFLAKVGAGKTILKFEKNQHVFKQGGVADAVFYIQKGSVKLTVLSEQGKEAVVGILEPGQFFGEGCLNGHPLRIATTTAMEECVITSITKESMIATLHTEPKFSELFMAYLLTRNSRVEEDLIDSFSIQARSDSRAFSFCSRISERKADLSLFWWISARRHWQR